MRLLISAVQRGLCVLAAVLLVLSVPVHAQTILRVYGPDGPGPAMKEAAAAFEKKTGVKVEVTDGLRAQWMAKAKKDADLIFSGSEIMMSEFVSAMDGQISLFNVTPLYLRPFSILVRTGNPKHIRGVQDIIKPGTKIMVINGAGLRGVWEDMASRKGDLNTLASFRKNIVFFAKDSVEAKEVWIKNREIDVWMTWNIRQIPNERLADLVPLDSEHVIYRSCGITATQRAKGKPAAKAFIDFLQSKDGAAIFAKWGWTK